MSSIKFIIIVGLIFLSGVHAFAQNDRVRLDSLISVLDETADTTRLWTLEEISTEYIPVSLDSAHIYANRLLQESKIQEDNSFIGDAFNMIGYILREMDRMEEALIYFNQALELRLD